MIRQWLISLTLTALAAGAGAAEIEILEEAIEAQPITVQLTSKSTGRILVLRCEECDPEPFIITPESQLFAGAKALKMADLPAYADIGGTVMYKPGTNIVTRILVWGE